MDIPATMQDWWVYVLPGGYLLIQTFFLADALTHIFHTSPEYYVGNLISYTQNFAVPVVVALGAGALIVGSVLEGLSFNLFNRIQDDRKVMQGSLNALKTYDLTLYKDAFGSPDLLPAELHPKDIESVTLDEASSIFDYLEPLAYDICNDNEIAVVEETATARTFSQSFFLAFQSTLAFALWLLARGFTIPTAAVVVGFVMVDYYLWKDSSALGVTYYSKLFRISYVHRKASGH